MSPGREGEPSAPTGRPASTVRTALPDAPQKAAETSARRLGDVNADVQQTSPSAPAAEQSASRSVLPVGKPFLTELAQSSQTDVQVLPSRSVTVADSRPRSPKQTRKSKRQTDQDASGRYRHTLRLETKAEQKLRAVAEALGVDMNAAISVCIAEKYHRLIKPGGGDV